MDIAQLGFGGLSPSSEIPTQRLASGDDFLRILGAQLQAQNPLEPMQETEFLGQLAQFSQLEESIATNRNLQAIGLLQDSLAAIQQMTDGAALIGKSIEFTDLETGEQRTGTVQAIRVEDGVVVLDVDGESVPLPLLSAVLGVAGEEESTSDG